MTSKANERVRTAIDWLIGNGYAASQRQLAERINYNPSTISLILNEKISVTPKFARTISEFSKGTISDRWLLSGKGTMIDTGEIDNSPTMADILAERDALEDKIADALIEFYNTTGIATSGITINWHGLHTNHPVCDVNIPLHFPSTGSASRNEEANLHSDTHADLPPVEFEEAVVSACLQDASVLSTISFLLSDMFTNANLGVIYHAITEMSSQGTPIDANSISNYIATHLDADITPDYISSIQCAVLNTNHVEFHASCIYNYAIAHNTSFKDMTPKEFTQTNPVIKEAYELLKNESN